MARKWGKPDNVIAERFRKDQIPGFFKKEVILENFEVGIAKKYNSIVDVFRSGRHNIKDDFTEVILIDTKPKILKKVVDDIITADDNSVSCELEIKFGVNNPENLLANLLEGKIILTLDDLFVELNSSLISRVLAPTIRDANVDDLYGNRDLIDEIQVSFEIELKKMLDIWGIELLNLSLLWKFPENYKQYMKSSSMRAFNEKTKEKDYEESARGAVRERTLKKIKGSGEPTTEEVKSRLEKEALEKDLDLEIRKKESIQDTQEAMDALKLKQLLKKQKTQNEEDE